MYNSIKCNITGTSTLIYMYHLYQVSINGIEINTSVEKYFSITPILLENDSGLLLQFLFSLKITIKLQL